MTRRLSINDTYPEQPVSEFQIAPHRYRYDRDDGHSKPASLREFLKAVPYQRGDVVLVALGNVVARAYVLSVNVYRNSWGDRCESYRVLMETKKGYWSKSWRRTYPGPIQRGYALAGRAPDVPTQ